MLSTSQILQESKMEKPACSRNLLTVVNLKKNFVLAQNDRSLDEIAVGIKVDFIESYNIVPTAYCVVIDFIWLISYT